jgi:histidine triad (HIT) family protein
MERCPFCFVSAEGLPGHAVFNDDECFVLLDRESLGPGHCMVVARRHVPTIYDLPESEYRHLFDVARWLAPRLAEAVGTKAVGYVAFGTGLPHAHLHLVPMDDSNVLLAPRPTLVDDAELADRAHQLRAHLST